MTEIGDLIEQTGEIRVAFEKAREDVRTRITQAEAQQHSDRRLAFGGAILGCIGVLVALLSLSNAHDANNAVHRANLALAANTSNEPGSVRWASCQQFNKQQAAGIVAEQGEYEALLPFVITDPAKQVEVRQAIHDLVVEERKLRDCSPAGIAAYLAHP